VFPTGCVFPTGVHFQGTVFTAAFLTGAAALRFSPVPLLQMARTLNCVSPSVISAAFRAWYPIDASDRDVFDAIFRDLHGMPLNFFDNPEYQRFLALYTSTAEGSFVPEYTPHPGASPEFIARIQEHTCSSPVIARVDRKRVPPAASPEFIARLGYTAPDSSFRVCSMKTGAKGYSTDILTTGEVLTVDGGDDIMDEETAEETALEILEAARASPASDFSGDVFVLRAVIANELHEVHTAKITVRSAVHTNGHVIFASGVEERAHVFGLMHPNVAREDMAKTEALLVFSRFEDFPGVLFATPRDTVCPRLAGMLNLAKDDDGASVGVVVRVSDAKHALGRSSTYVPQSMLAFMFPGVQLPQKSSVKRSAAPSRRPAKKNSHGVHTFTRPLLEQLQTAPPADRYRITQIVNFLTALAADYPETYAATFVPLYTMAPSMFYTMFDNPAFLELSIKTLDAPDAKLNEYIASLNC